MKTCNRFQALEQLAGVLLFLSPARTHSIATADFDSDGESHSPGTESSKPILDSALQPKASILASTNECFPLALTLRAKSVKAKPSPKERNQRICCI
jgi:hypothetical protein